MVSKKVSAKPAKNVSSDHDLSGMSWDELRALAKSCGVPAKGKRPKLEAAIKKQLSSQTHAASVSKSPKKVPTKTKVTKKKAVTSKKAVASKKTSRKKVATKAPTTAPTLRGLGDDSTVFKIGQRVEVKSNRIRGKVVEVTQLIAVALESGLTEEFTAGQLKKLPPLL